MFTTLGNLLIETAVNILINYIVLIIRTVNTEYSSACVHPS